MSYKYFAEIKDKVVTINAERFNEITEEVTRDIKFYKDRYVLENMMVLCSVGKDSIDISIIVRTVLRLCNIL